MNALQILINSVLQEEAVAGSEAQALGAQSGIFSDDTKYPVNVAMSTAIPKSKKKRKKFFPKVVKRTFPELTTFKNKKRRKAKKK